MARFCAALEAGDVVLPALPAKALGRASHLLPLLDRERALLTEHSQESTCLEVERLVTVSQQVDCLRWSND